LESDQILLLPLWYAMFLLSVTCHEAAHAWVAHRGGDDTAYLGGQVTLNPLPHVQREPFGTILVPLLTYLNMHWMMGWASAPYDPSWEDRHPRRAAAMAAAGPAANLILALIALVALKVGLAAGLWVVPAADAVPIDRLVAPAGDAPAAAEGLGRLLSIMLTLNLVLTLFNLLPLPPMDGAAVVSGLFAPARRLRDRLRATPWAGLVGLLVAWYVFGYVFHPVFRPIVAWLHG
jgi:Zn-dependent protease